MAIGRRMLGSALLGALATPAIVHRVGATTDQILLVDAGADLGPVPPILRVGTWPFTPAPPAYVQDQFLADFRPGTVQIDLGHEVFRPSSDSDELLGRLAVLDPFLIRLAKAGHRLVLSMSKMPPFLSAAAGNRAKAMGGDETTVAEASAPRNYAVWSQLLQAVAAHVGRLGIRADYNIGWEPDTALWQGTEEEFFKLYAASVVGIRRADPTARIGGPSVSDLGAHWRSDPTGPSMMERFIAYAAGTPLPELGLARLPIDFLSFHFFGGDPNTSYRVRAQLLTSLMRRHGYPDNTPLFVGEWSDSPAATGERRDSPMMAGFLIASLIGMASAGVHSAAFTSLTEQQTAAETEFNGGFGLFTKSFIKRPTYRAFQMLNALGDRRIKATFDGGADGLIHAVAGRSNDAVTAVAAHFVPFHGVMLRAFADEIMRRGHSIGELSRHVRSGDQLERLLRDTGPSSSGLPQPIMSDVAAAAAAVRGRADQIRAIASQPVQMRVVFSGVSALGLSELWIYRIDSAHENAAALKDKIDRALSTVTRESGTKIRQDALLILQQDGASEADLSLVRGFGAARDKQAFMASISAGQRLSVIRMVRSLQARQDAAVAAEADHFNRDPRLAFMPAERRTLSGQTTIEATVTVDPGTTVMLQARRS